MKNSLRKLHNDERAQVSFLAVMGAVVFVGLLAMIINTNDIIRQRIHVQEVADVAALSSATWTARGMNLTSMVNMLNTKVLTMTVLVKSLHKTLPIVLGMAAAQKAAFSACSGVPFVGVFCAVMNAVVTIQEVFLKGMKKVIDKMEPHMRCQKSASAFRLMNGLQKSAEAIRSSFPLIAIAESLSIARVNATTGLALNGGAMDAVTGSPASMFSLPTTSEDLTTEDFCPAIVYGGKGFELDGYEAGEGPATVGKDIWMKVFIPFANLLPHPIFYGFYVAYLKEIDCDPAPDTKKEGEEEVQLYDLPNCRKYNAQPTWVNLEATTGFVSNGNWDVDDFSPWRSLSDDGGAGDVDEGQFDGLGDFDPGSSGPDFDIEPPFTGSEGWEALRAANNETELYVEDTSTVLCEINEPSSGYPRVGDRGEDCDIDLLGSCEYIFEHDDFTLFSGKHIKKPARGDENTGLYYIKVEEPEEGTGDNEGKFQYTALIWTLVDAGETNLSGDDLDDYIQQQTGGEHSTQAPPKDTGCRSLVKPLLIDDGNNPAGRLRHIAFVWRDLEEGGVPGRPFWSNFFDTPPDRVTAYAQSQVYNDLSEDMFTQDWRVRLEQANLLEAALSNTKVANEGIVEDNVVTTFVQTVNNH